MRDPPARKEFWAEKSSVIDMYKHPDMRIFYFYDKERDEWWRL